MAVESPLPARMGIEQGKVLSSRHHHHVIIITSSSSPASFTPWRLLLWLGAIIAVLGCSGSHVDALHVTISNEAPRLDTVGEIMDCHDGNILQIDGLFWNFCMAYGSCHNKGCASKDCGGRLDHNISIYTSPNLTSGSWSYVADLLPVDRRPSATYYRPKVVLNPATKKYIFWVNLLPRASWNAPVDFSKSSYLVAEAEQPGGPYTIAVKNATTKYGEGGDFSLFVDDDSTGYLIYTSLAEAHSISIAPLNADFTQSLPLKNTAFLPGTDHTGCFEAPAMFKRRDVYFALVSVCSCFGVGGADVWVYTAAHPLGPYTRRADLGNAERSQQNYVFQVPLVDGDSYIWTGDRWKSTPDGEKAHDFQYWQPLNFSANVHPNGSKADVVIGSLLSAKTLPNFSLDLNAS